MGKIVVGSPDGLRISAANGEACDGASILCAIPTKVKQNARPAPKKALTRITSTHRHALIEIES
jgi:hypothetical protein